MIPVHPSRILKRQLAARELSANKLLLRLARFFGNSARFWLNLQPAYEQTVAEREIGGA
jgi:antitoxin HigA-1